MRDLNKNSYNGSTSRFSNSIEFSASKKNLNNFTHVVLPPIPNHGSVYNSFITTLLLLFTYVAQSLNCYRSIWWHSKVPHSTFIDVNLLDFFMIFHVLLMLFTYPLFRFIRYFLFVFNASSIFFNLPIISLILFWIFLYIFTLCNIKFVDISIKSRYDITFKVSLFFAIFCISKLYHNIKRVVFSLVFFLKSYGFPSFFALTKSVGYLCNSLFYRPYGSAKMIFPDGNDSSTLRLSGGMHVFFSQFLEPKKPTLTQLVHKCPNNLQDSIGTAASFVRVECDAFLTDFFYRMKDCIVATLFGSFYAGFLPIYCAYVQNLSVDYHWCFLTAVLSTSCLFCFNYVHYIPFGYLNNFHRCYEHLGSWKTLNNQDSKQNNSNVTSWCSSKIYQQGVIVKHSKGLFESRNMHNSAIPGYKIHKLFYFLFSDPTFISSNLALVSFTIVVVSVMMIHNTHEWYKVIGLGISVLIYFSNLFTCFKIAFLFKFSYPIKLQKS